MLRQRSLALAVAPIMLALLASCSLHPDQPETNTNVPIEGSENSQDIETIGTISRLSSTLDEILPIEAEIEVLARGFVWPEGPVWVDNDSALYFDDVPENKMYRWTAEDGTVLFLSPSGGGGEAAKSMREPGANGLIKAPKRPGHLLLADHGARGLSLLNLESKSREVLVSQFQGKSLNSPNDMAARSDGAIFFTDPPYGLRGLNEAPEKELPFNGVYMYQAGQPLKLLTDALSFPNGIALSPDEETLYVAVSDPDNPIIMAYELASDGSLGASRILFDGSPYLETGNGLPDGMVVAKNGIIFATGPGGVYVLEPNAGEILGVISTGMPISNCTLDDDEKYLYMTSSSVLARVAVDLL